MSDTSPETPDETGEAPTPQKPTTGRRAGGKRARAGAKAGAGAGRPAVGSADATNSTERAPHGTDRAAVDSQAAGGAHSSTQPQEPAVGDGAAVVEEVAVAAAPGGRRAAVAAQIEELEVEIRNRESPQQPRLQELAAGALQLIRENLERGAAASVEPVARALREGLHSDYLDPDFWRGVGMGLRYQLDETRGLIERRIRGDYTTDAYGMDEEIVGAVRPFASFLYRTWWRVTARGLEHVPASGGALLVANHAGMIPWDGAMIATAVIDEGPGRMVRILHDPAVERLPVLAPALAALGQVPALPENVAALLADGQLVLDFPEGTRGTGKLFWQRYRLASFGSGASFAAAIRAGAPIVPVAVVGSEETYPLLANFHSLARMVGLAFIPITPFFPWLGPLGMIPLPSKWSITFLPPISTAVDGAARADDPAFCADLAEQVRTTIQGALDAELRARPSVF